MPYNKYIRKNSLKSSEGFTFVFADIRYKESFKTNLVSMYCKFVFICAVQMIPAATKIWFYSTYWNESNCFQIHGVWKHPEELSKYRNETFLHPSPLKLETLTQ